MSDDLFAAVHARPKRRQGITGQTIDAQMRGTICQITEWELEELSAELSRLRAEVERLTKQLNDADTALGTYIVLFGDLSDKSPSTIKGLHGMRHST